MTPPATLPIFILIFLTKTITPQSTNSTPTLSQISETFETLLTRTSPTKTEYLNLLTNIEEYATKNNEQTNWQNDEKKVLNLVSAAIVSKILVKSSKDLPIIKCHKSKIQSKIDNLEENRIPLAEYILEEYSKLNSEFANQKAEDNLSSHLARLKSKIQSARIPEDANSQTTRNSQALTINLLQIFVCTSILVQKSIQATTEVPHALLFMEQNNNFQLNSTCEQVLSQFQTQLITPISHLTTLYVGSTRNIQTHLSILRNSSNPQTLEQLKQLITSASQLEASILELKTDLEAVPGAGNLYNLASFYELEDPSEFAIESNTTQWSIIQNLRNQRQRIYSNIVHLISKSSKTDKKVITDTLDAIADANCDNEYYPINLKDFELKLTKLNYFNCLKILSDLMVNLNTPQASRIMVQNASLKTLSSLSKQVIKSSLLQIQQNNLKSKLSGNSVKSWSRLKTYTFVLTEGPCSPDNYIQTCYLINGQYPGPPIIVNQQDFLRVEVINKMSVATTLHFHGILQSHTASSDGVAHVTQDPIKPNHTYIYETLISQQTGTYMYHGHIGLDLIWLHGPLIIKENPEEWKSLRPEFKYDDEHTFMLEEIFHQTFDDLIKGMLEEGIDDPPVTSFGINGKSYGNWSTSQGSAPGYSVVRVIPGKTYRIRVINMVAGSMLHFTIENHNMTVIEMDGIITEPVTTNRLEIHTGQRYSVLVKMDRDPGNYWVQAKLMGEDGGPGNGRGIIHYNCAEDYQSLRTQVFSEPTEPIEIKGNGWILDELMPNEKYKQSAVYDFPEKSDRQILIDMQMRTVDGPPRFLVNGNLYKKPNTSYWRSVQDGADLSGDSHVFPVKMGEVIDMIFQNRVDDTGGCDEHPIHTHGHSFWVVGGGPDEVNMGTIKQKLSQEKGNHRQFRDTFTQFPNMTVESEVSGTPCGWTAIRFVADNPGLWLVHCHVTSHMILGKMFVLYEFDERNTKLINE